MTSNIYSKAQAYDDLAITPAELATLAGLRSGKLVAVPRPTRTYARAQNAIELLYPSQIEADAAMLAAASEAQE
jgi:hypothetical protein